MSLKTFVMTKAQYEKLLEACKPVIYIKVGSYEPSSPQQNANAAWRALGSEMGFKWDTAVPGASDKEFKAEPINLEEGVSVLQWFEKEGPQPLRRSSDRKEYLSDSYDRRTNSGDRRGGESFGIGNRRKEQCVDDDRRSNQHTQD